VTDYPRRVPRWPYVLLRGTTTSLAVLAVAQAVIAGSFLSGHYDALTVHLVTAMVMTALTVAQAVTVVFVRRAGGPRSVMLIGLLLPLLVAGQGGLGMGRVLGLHVPLGVMLVVGVLRLTAWAWRTPLPTRVQAVDTARDNQPVGALS
jgi:hypothetical protein